VQPADGLKIAQDTALEATAGDACVTAWTLHAVRTRDVLVGTRDAMVQLGTATFPATSAPTLLPGPNAPGDWTLRLATAYETVSKETIWSVKFFRLLVGDASYETPVVPSTRPTIEPTPAITPTVACQPPDVAAGPPPVNVVVNGGTPIPGTIGAFSWYDVGASSGQLHLEPGPTIPFEANVELQIGGDACATRWTIASMSWPDVGLDFTEVEFGEQASWARFDGNRSDNPVISQQNRIVATATGLGRTVIRALLSFEGGQTVQAYWLVTIEAFPPPEVRVSAPGSDPITPVAGCGAGLSTSENYFGEECPPNSWPILADGPIITAHDGDVVRIDVVDLGRHVLGRELAPAVRGRVRRNRYTRGRKRERSRLTSTECHPLARAPARRLEPPALSVA